MITFREFLDLCEDYNPNAEFVIFNKKTRAVLGTARGFDQAKTKASSIRKQRGLKFDDVSFMTSRRFYGKRTPAASTGRRIEYAPRYNPSKRGRFRGVWHPDGSYAYLYKQCCCFSCKRILRRFCRVQKKTSEESHPQRSSRPLI